MLDVVLDMGCRELRFNKSVVSANVSEHMSSVDKGQLPLGGSLSGRIQDIIIVLRLGLDFLHAVVWVKVRICKACGGQLKFWWCLPWAQCLASICPPCRLILHGGSLALACSLLVPHHSRYILGSGERVRGTSLGSPLHQPGSMTLHLTLHRCVKVSWSLESALESRKHCLNAGKLLIAHKNQTHFLVHVGPPFCSFPQNPNTLEYMWLPRRSSDTVISALFGLNYSVYTWLPQAGKSHFPAITRRGPLSISPSKEDISLLHVMSSLLHCTCGNQLETEFSHSLAQLHSSSEDKKIASTFTGLPWQLVKLGQDVGADNMAWKPACARS